MVNDQSDLNKKLISLIKRECSRAEEKELLRLIHEYPEIREKWQDLQRIWRLTGKLELNSNEETAWQKVSQRVAVSDGFHKSEMEAVPFRSNRAYSEKDRYSDSLISSNTSTLKWFFRVAAVLVVAVGLSIAVYITQQGWPSGMLEATSKQQFREITTERGEITHLGLRDGSKVILNAGSKIRIPEAFDEDHRTVELEGEAYFNVTPEEERPFLVQTKDAEIQVLGTEFDVNAYAENRETGITVVEGKVAVRSALNGTDDAGTSDEVLLRKGQYSSVERGTKPSSVEDVNIKPIISWIEGRLIFDRTPLREVLTRLEHYYNQDFEVDDNSLLDQRLTASFNHKENLSKVLEIISLSLDLEYEQTSNQIIFKSKDKSNN